MKIRILVNCRQLAFGRSTRFARGAPGGGLAVLGGGGRSFALLKNSGGDLAVLGVEGILAMLVCLVEASLRSVLRSLYTLCS